jgi:hypothetical protein
VGLTRESPQVKQPSLHNPLIKVICGDFHATGRSGRSTRTCMWAEGPQQGERPRRRGQSGTGSQPGHPAETTRADTRGRRGLGSGAMGGRGEGRGEEVGLVIRL